MAVITISRGSYSGGKMLAEALAWKLGYRCIDRDLLVQKAARWGVSANDLNTALETPPSFLGFSRRTAHAYLAVIQAALAEEIRDGNAIYHGLAGHLLLRDSIHVFRVRLIAPMEFRIGMVQDRLKLSRNDAIAYIQNKDQGRRKWTRLLYGVDWEDPSLYDLVVNLDPMSIEQARDLICSMLEQESFRTTAESLQALSDLAIASRIRANLAMDPATSDLELEVRARFGAVSIKGGVVRVDQGHEVERIARSVPGVKSVVSQLALVARL